MGVDKAMVLSNGRPLVAVAVDALRWCDRVSVIHRVPESLRALTSLDGVDVIVDDEGGQGPLDGLRTALRHSRCDLTAVLAVDLVAAGADVFDDLTTALGPGDVAAAAVGPTLGKQGLLSVWRTEGARSVVDDWFESGERSVHGLLDTISVRWVQMDDRRLRNVNTPDDLLDE